jgi:hypothetical protein
MFFTYGFHAFNLIDILFIKEREMDFHEMLSHHIATNCLYLSSLLSNCLGVGAVIAWFHDLADVFVSSSRGLNCMGCDRLAPITLVGLLISWIYTRVVVLPIYIYHVSFDLIHPEP